MKRSLLAPSLFLIIFSFSFVVAAENTTTLLGVPDSPPYIIQDIPNLFLITGDDYTNYLDLDNYFGEDNGDDLNITFTSVNNITIMINSEHKVSFYPDPNYIGTQQMRFTVADAVGTVTGNWFNITVGEDNIPPKWFNPAKDKTKIYQNSAVNFTTTWTDNLGLESFIFSINQGSGWVNSTLNSMTGLANVSRANIIVSASPGTTAYWMFYATDIYGNSNSTAIQNFTIQEVTDPGDSAEGNEGGDDTLDEIRNIISAREPTTDQIAASNFKIDVGSIKLSLRQGDTVTKTIKVTNTGGSTLSFITDIESLRNLAIVSDKTFSLEPGQTKELTIDFKAPSTIMPDQYFGYLTIEADEAVKIPIILDIRAFESEISVTVFIPEKYKTTNAGKEAKAIVTITSTKDLREANLTIFYALKDFEGNILESNTTKRELFSSLEETFNLTVPKETPQGEYLFYVRATGENLIDIGSDTFFVGTRFKIMRILQRLFYPFLFAILGLIVLILITTYRKNKKKQKALELYIMLNELRDLVKEGKTEAAVEIYKRIKITYGQHISSDFQKDKDKLKLELDKFAKLLNQNPIQMAKPSTPPQAKQVATKQAVPKPAAPQTPVVQPKPATVSQPKPASSPQNPKPAQPVTKPQNPITKLTTAIKEAITPPPAKPVSPPPAKNPVSTPQPKPLPPKPATTPPPKPVATPPPKPASTPAQNPPAKKEDNKNAT